MSAPDYPLTVISMPGDYAVQANTIDIKSLSSHDPSMILTAQDEG